MSDMTFGEWLLAFLSNHPDLEIRYNYLYYLNAIRIQMTSYEHLPIKFVDHLVSRNIHDSTLFDSILIETIKHMYEQLTVSSTNCSDPDSLILPLVQEETNGSNH